jgi:hypothetical protein
MVLLQILPTLEQQHKSLIAAHQKIDAQIGLLREIVALLREGKNPTPERARPSLGVVHTIRPADTEGSADQ